MKVIIAIDDSPYSKQVVGTLIKRHWPAHMSFKILTVLEPLPTSGYDFDHSAAFAETLQEIDKHRHEAAEHFCQEVRHRIEAEIPNAIAHYEIREGLPRTEIINSAVDWMADAIMLGAHGKDVCPHNLLGSVSRAIVNHAPCSVEVIRPRESHKWHPTDKHTATSAT